MYKWTHHGQTEIFLYILGHVDQPPLWGSNQDEAVQGWKEGLVRQRAAGSISPQQGVLRKGSEWGEPWWTPCISAGLALMRPRLYADDRFKDMKAQPYNRSVKTYPGREQTSWCRRRWRTWSAGRRDVLGSPGWRATGRAYSGSHDWCGPVGLWTLLW